VNATTSVLYQLAAEVGGHGHGHGHGGAASSIASSGPSVGWVALTTVFSASVVAAALTGLVNGALARRKSSEEERSRIRTVFAEALEVVAAYKEFPYAIRRRDGNEPGKERVRLSEELRQVQSRLTYYTTWIHAESSTVGDAYDNLVSALRRVAGGACRDAWLADPITEDAQMNIGPDLVDLSELKPLEASYASEAEKYLAQYVRPWWKRKPKSP
jgi:hypothetical protein